MKNILAFFLGSRIKSQVLSRGRRPLQMEILEERQLLAVDSLSLVSVPTTLATADDIVYLSADVDISWEQASYAADNSLNVEIVYDSSLVGYLPNAAGNLDKGFNSCRYTDMNVSISNIANSNSNILSVDWNTNSGSDPDTGWVNVDLRGIISQLGFILAGTDANTTDITIRAWTGDQDADDALTDSVTLTLGTPLTDTVSPVFTVNGTQATTNDQVNYTASRSYSVGDAWSDPLAGTPWVTAYDAFDDASTVVSVDTGKTSDIVDISTAGTYHLYYKTADVTGNTSYLDLSIVVNPVTPTDTASPVFTVNGNQAATSDQVNYTASRSYSVGDAWSDPLSETPWVTAYDVFDDASTAVSVDTGKTSDTVDINIAGTYHLYYKTADTAGNTSYLDLSIVVNPVAPIDTVSPVYTVNGTQAATSDQVNFTASRSYSVGGDWSDPLAGTPWVTAYDAFDDASTVVSVDTGKTSDSVDTNTAGTYHLYYKTADVAGNTSYLDLSIVVSQGNQSFELTETITAVANDSPNSGNIASGSYANFSDPKVSFVFDDDSDAKDYFSLAGDESGEVRLYYLGGLAEGNYDLIVKMSENSNPDIAISDTITVQVATFTFDESSVTIDKTNSGLINSYTHSNFTSVFAFVWKNGNLMDSTGISVNPSDKTISYDGTLDAGTYAITVMLSNDDYSLAIQKDFTLILTDDTSSDEWNISTFNNAIYMLDTDGTNVFLKGDDDTLYTALLTDMNQITIKGDALKSENFRISNAAMNALNAIYINGSDDDSTAFRDIVTIEGADDARTFTVGNAGDEMELLTGETGQDSIYGSGLVSLEGGAILAFVGVKNFNIESKADDRFNLTGLSANINIDRTNASSDGATLDFSQVQLTANDPGVVLNLGSTNHQAALIGQSGSLRIRGGNVQNVILSQGADTITGNVAGNTITDSSESQNVVILKGGDNDVDLGGASTVVAKGESGNNNIDIIGAQSVVNLVQSQATNTVNVNGDNSVVNGGKGDDTITVSGNYVVVSATQGGNDTVKVIGNNFSLSTGAGNDDITVIGSYGNVSAGAGDDTIRVEDNPDGTESTGNMISGGDGNDFIYAVLSSGANIYYANAGNDFIVGGTGNDTIYGNSGNNFLAGGFGKDQVNGGSGRDILVGSQTSNLANLDETALQDIYEELLNVWMNDENADVISILGETSLRDDQADTLRGGNDNILDIFFANSLDNDIENALEHDLVYKG